MQIFESLVNVYTFIEGAGRARQFFFSNGYGSYVIYILFQINVHIKHIIELYKTYKVSLV